MAVVAAVEEARVALQVEEEEARVADAAVQRALWAPPPLLPLLLPLAVGVGVAAVAALLPAS